MPEDLNRREFIQHSAAGLAGIAAATAAPAIVSADPSPSPPRRPNLLFIMTDQPTPDSFIVGRPKIPRGSQRSKAADRLRDRWPRGI